MSLVAEIITRLSSQAVGGSSAGATWRLVARDFMPGTIGGSTQAQQICVTPTGGYDQEYSEAVTYPTFQVRVRGKSTGSTGLEAKAAGVVSALNLMGPRTISGRVYLDCFQQGDLLYLGRDENQRPIVALNFMAVRSRTT